VTDMSNPLFDDDDDEEFILPKAPSEPKGVSGLPDIGDFGIMPELSDEPMPSGVTNSYQDGDAFSADEDEDDLSVEDLVGDLLDSAEEVSTDLFDSDLAPEAVLGGILDSLGDLDDDIPEPLEETADERMNALIASGGGTADVDDYEGRFIDLDKVIGVAIEAGASDIHLNADDEIAFTILGDIHRYSEFGVLDSDMTVKLQQTIISNVLEQAFVEDLELDTSYIVRTGKYKGRRLRLSVGKEAGNVFMVFRIITNKMPTPEEIGIPTIVQNWFKLPAGLLLVNGPTGSGKSTSLSSLMQVIQYSKRKNIITLERPVEFKYGNNNPGQLALFKQREVGRDTRSFKNGLVSAMRQAPNIILVGEVRFKEEIDELLTAAETGHLAISTLHTTSCPATINRIRSMYEGDDQRRVLATLSDNLRGMMTQALVMAADGESRVAVFEVLQINAELKHYVLEGNVQAIRDYMEKNGITMEHELVKAVHAGKVRVEDARGKAPDPLYFDELYES
jgi:twitching motility protein PilT